MIPVVTEMIKYHDYIIETYGDPRVDGWFLVNSIWSILGIIAVYLCFVLYIGPKFMENRKPFELQMVLIVYNVIQVICCIALFTAATIYVIPYYSLRCEPCRYSLNHPAMMQLTLTWWYLVSKIIELLDTVFFVLKKNYRQLTFLHIYHHAEMVFFSWMASRFVACGSSIYLGYMNIFVHIVMYSYYLASVISKHRQLVWLKRQITHIQLLQFVLICVIYTAILLQPDCDFPKGICLIFITQAAFMMYLFLRFYIKSYIKPKVR